ncbi:MAG: phosphodiester glycosidase family protein [Clostridia bacterium]
MRKAAFMLLSVLVIAMALSLTFCIPSGLVTEEAQSRYTDAAYAEEESAAKLKPVAVLAANAVFSDILPAANIDPLALDIATPGSTPIEANFTATGYRDDSIIVEMEKQRLYDSDVFVAYVKIATPSQLRTAIAGTKLTSTRTNHPTQLSENYNAIVAINGDYYPNTKGGYVVRQGESCRTKTSANLDLLFIDELGDFHLLPRGNENQKNAIEAFQSAHELVNGFFFGPALVIDGKAQEIPENYEFAPTAKNPRAAIGQIGPLTYAMVAVNGRTDASAGVTMKQLADIMEQIGCQQAYNLDGGNSATLVFHGAMFNDKPQAERAVTDIIYFASATDAK